MAPSKIEMYTPLPVEISSWAWLVGQIKPSPAVWASNIVWVKYEFQNNFILLHNLKAYGKMASTSITLLPIILSDWSSFTFSLHVLIFGSSHKIPCDWLIVSAPQTLEPPRIKAPRHTCEGVSRLGSWRWGDSLYLWRNHPFWDPGLIIVEKANWTPSSFSASWWWIECDQPSLSPASCLP